MLFASEAKPRRRTGREVTFEESKAFKAALFLDPEGYRLNEKKSAEEIRVALDRIGFTDLNMEDALAIAHDMIESFNAAMCGLQEAVTLSMKLDVPVICHNSPENKEYVVKAAQKLGPKLIASHSNHMFEVKEAVEQARKLKGYGALIDIYTGDSFGARQMVPSPEVTFALLEEGLVDIVSTDFIAGYWDSILLVLERAVEQGIIALPKAVKLATSNVIKAIPKLAPNRGLVQPGKVADLVITEPGSLSKVNMVLISGRIVVHQGVPINRAHGLSGRWSPLAPS